MHRKQALELPFNLTFVFLVVVLVFVVTHVGAHQESGEWACEADDEARVVAQFRPGVVSIDGHADDWKDVDGFEFPLYPALDPDADHQYQGGKMTVKALHDGKDVHFMLQVDGNYVYSKGDDKKCASVALMFQVGDSATYHDMGGCKEKQETCTSKSCRGYEVDIMHFSVGSAVPGRLYGGNPIDNRDGNGDDRFGHLVDMYSWNPHCRNLDGISPSGNDTSAQNDWKGAWWHDSFTTHSGFIEEDSPYASSGQKGTYYFEFSRSLRTMDRLQQDVQFSIGQTTKFSAAFWYPVDGKPWTGHMHYTVSCDWVPLEISPGNDRLSRGPSGSSSSAASAFALLLSVLALCVSVFIGYQLTRSKSMPFTPIDPL